MKALTVISLLFSGWNLSAQLAIPEQQFFDTTRCFIKYSGNIDMQSSSLQNEFTYKFIKGGAITNELKASTVNQQEEINRFGIEIFNQILVAPSLQKFKHLPYTLAFEYNNTNLISASYNQDLFRFAFEGNANTLGDTLFFKGNNFSSIAYHSYGLGLIDKISKSYFTVNFIKLRNYQNHTVQDGYFFSSADSSYIDTKMKGDVLFSTPESEGIGLQINFQYNKKLPWVKEKEAIFFFQMRNLGLMKVSNIERYHIDTNIHFNGFQLTPFIYQNDSLEGVNWLDTLSVSHDTISKLVATPMSIHFGKTIDFSSDEKIQSYFGIKLFPSIKYVPKLYFGINFRLAKSLHAGLGVSYGGFGNIRSSGYLQLNKEKLKLGLGTEDLAGLISRKAYGKNVSIRLLCAF